MLNATALVTAIGNGKTFARGRDLAAWLGLVPRQATTGGKPRLLGISKRGNKYLRKLLIHGARAAMPFLARSATAHGCVACWQGRIPTLWLWPWPTNWPGLSGPSCGMDVSSRGPTSWHRRRREFGRPRLMRDRLSIVCWW